MEKITLDVIAQDLQVSKNTVSKALRGKPGVSEDLRLKIVEIANKYGYRVKSRENDEITPTHVTMICNNALPPDVHFWPSVLGGIYEYSSQRNISIQTMVVDLVNGDQYIPLSLYKNYCDGIIVVGTISEKLFAHIATLGIPMVALDHYNDYVKCDYINTANKNGALRALDFLVSHSHKKIGFISNINAPYITSLTDRYLGFRDRMEYHGLAIDENFIWLESYYENTQYFKEQLDKLDAYGDAPTAWICVNDLTAYNLCSELAERGIRVPEDVSVIGFDNIPGIFSPKLTTMEIPKKYLGRRALQRLMYRLKHPEEPFENIEIFTRLIDRGSVIPLK